MNSWTYQEHQSIRPPNELILGHALESAEAPITDAGGRDRSELAGFNQDAHRDDLEGMFMSGTVT